MGIGYRLGKARAIEKEGAVVWAELSGVISDGDVGALGNGYSGRKDDNDNCSPRENAFNEHCGRVPLFVKAWRVFRHNFFLQRTGTAICDWRIRAGATAWTV